MLPVVWRGRYLTGYEGTTKKLATEVIGGSVA
jgi:hypothetical protein